jgi:glycosyltransferase involved in cell wall biosynthesis
MKIAFDTSSFQGAHAGRGIGVYAKSLYEALVTYETGNTYLPFSDRKTVPAGADIVHYPSFEPFFLTLPVRSPVPFVATVHDLTPIAMPQLFPLGVKGRLKWQIQRRLLTGASRIITDSEQSKRDVVRFTGFPADRIDPVYLAPRGMFLDRQGADGAPEGFPPRYILYVGDVNRNKNIVGLLRGYRLLLDSLGPGIPELVLVGKALVNHRLAETAEIDGTVRELKLEDLVVRPGYVPDDQLVRAYRSAAAAVQPSLYEGFGFPVVEAMASGCLVVTTNAGSLAEIAGPSIVVSPDPASLADGLKRMLSLAEPDRKRMIAAGSEWVSRFTWQRVAHETTETYRKAVTGK